MIQLILHHRWLILRCCQMMEVMYHCCLMSQMSWLIQNWAAGQWVSS